MMPGQSARCVFPAGGVATVNEPLVIHEGCVGHRYQLHPDGLFQHWHSGMCVLPRGGPVTWNVTGNLLLQLTLDCNAKTNTQLQFQLLAGGQIMHVASGNCVRTEGGLDGDNVPLHLFHSCVPVKSNTFKLWWASPFTNA